MSHHDEKTAECLVFTFKDGLLSKVAHDLKLRVTRFSVDVDLAELVVNAELDARSLRVVHAVHGGEAASAALSDADKEKIAAQIQKEVMHAEQHPRIAFSSRRVSPRHDGGYSISGELNLHGTTRSISFETRIEGERQVADVELHQPDYGIVPFKAMLGTLKVKPNVRVRIAIPNA
jgi:polyisoprenoid-binding protein YceI